MATFFGEISALTSRAVDDEEIDDQPIYNLTVDSQEDCPVSIGCKLLIFSVDEISYTFVQSHLVPNSPRHLFTVNYSSNEKSDSGLMYTGGMSQRSNIKKAASVYSIDENVIVCDVEYRLPEELSNELYAVLLDKVNSDEAVVFMSLPSVQYQMATPEKPFLKSLATSKYLSDRSCSIPALKGPNYVSEFPAAVMTDFEVKKKPALCLINYVRRYSVDSIMVRNFFPIFDENLNVKLAINSNSNAKLKRMLDKMPERDFLSNLYT